EHALLGPRGVFRRHGLGQQVVERERTIHLLPPPLLARLLERRAPRLVEIDLAHRVGTARAATGFLRRGALLYRRFLDGVLDRCVVRSPRTDLAGPRGGQLA